MIGYAADIEKETLKNNNFRKVLFTGKYMQLVVMSIKPGEEIGLEVHKNVDQFFRVEQGEVIFLINNKQMTKIREDGVFIVPAGTKHNVINKSKTETAKLYTIYTPPNHPPKTVHKTLKEAIDAEHHH